MKHLLALLMLGLLFLNVLYAEEIEVSEDSVKSSFELLTSKNFKDKTTAINVIADSGSPIATEVLSALLEGNVYYHKKNKDIVLIIESAPKNYDIKNPITDTILASKTKKELKQEYRKVGINNKLRGLLNEKIATLTIFSDDKKMRLNATRNMLKNPSPSTLDLLRDAVLEEKDSEVKELMNVCIAAANTKSNDVEIQLNAINSLSGSLYPEIRHLLEDLKSKYTDNAQADERIFPAVESALDSTNLKVGFNKQLENIFFGLSLGSVLLLAAVGLAITFGVMGVINMAHGEMLMLGAYTTFVVQQLMPNSIEYSLFVAIPAAFVVTGLIGIGIERGIIRFLYGRPLETLLATFGLSLVLQQAVRSVFSPLNRSVITPEWMSGSYEFNPALSLTYNRMYIVVFALLVLLGLLWLLKKTSFGLQMRAVTQNRNMAKAMGIRTNWVDSLTFGLGSGIAGIGGVALSQLTNVGPNLGQAYIVDSFMVVVFGGVGNLWGTFFGAMTLGIANKFMEPFTGAVFAKILVLIFIILFIQKYPRGMFALKGRAADS
ncbi:MAG: urea ABC transporter permease subunit UrtB [Gammaproteobacteria bacterium]